ncbi:MAG: helix-turn-helix domain-containing protein [Nanoarchaeota archaeon]|nr:helix-turn-helix domain-containing protein [Nanoarchaeota archaeon]
MAGAFCEVYGDTIENEIMEYILENKELDFAAGDMAKELNVSRPKTYEVIKDFESKGYVKKSRIVGKTQLYLLNRENPRIRLFLKTFNECLRIIAEENSEKELLVAKAIAKKKA